MFFDNFTRSLLIASYNCRQQWLKDCNHDVIPVLCSPKYLNNLELSSPSSFHQPPPPPTPHSLKKVGVVTDKPLISQSRRNVSKRIHNYTAFLFQDKTADAGLRQLLFQLKMFCQLD